MKVSISQPTFLPWIGYFNMIKKSDVFVFLDNVKFKKQTWHMRNRLKSGSMIDESEIWAHIPTNLSKTDTMIKDVLIDNSQDWKKKHLEIFQYNYGNSYQTIEFLTELYQKDWERIADFNIELITKCCQYLEIETKLIRASELNVDGKKSHLILDICKHLNADELIANSGSTNYLEEDKEIFENENIKISYHNFNPTRYNQKGGIFIQNLSILDLLFSEFENSKNFI
ncbi:MAG: WbqC family protein [Arenibacter sp.]